jgi:hypothetical protein
MSPAEGLELELAPVEQTKPHSRFAPLKVEVEGASEAVLDRGRGEAPLCARRGNRQLSLASAVETARAALRDAATRHPRRAGTPLAEVARQTAQTGVAAGDRGASAAARCPYRRTGHALGTEWVEQGIAAPEAALAAVRRAAIGRRRWRTRGSGGRGSRRRGGRRAGIRRAAAGPLGDSALSGALRGGFYRAGLESPHWRRR